MKNYFCQGVSTQARLTLLSLLLCSFPAFSADFSFIEFNIAFVLGLSLPILIITGLLKPLVAVKWRFPVLISLSLLGMLYSLAYLSELQTLAVVSCATLFLMLLYLWPLNIETATESLLDKTCVYGGGLSAVIFLAVVWFVPAIELGIIWLLFGAITLLLSGLRIHYFLQNSTVHFVRLTMQWLIVLSFVIAMYLWLNAQINVTWLVVTCVASYLITIVNGSWLLVNIVIAKFSTGKSSNNLAVEDVFLYSHDPATNLPSYQHALHRFEKTLKRNNGSKYAAIVFKPTNFQQVNSVLGHHNSDILLLQFAYSLQRHVAGNESLLSFENKPQPVRLARLQSLNFLVVLDITDSRHPEKAMIEEVCKQLSAAVPDAMSFKSFSLHFELAFGIAISGEHGNGVEELVSYAGDALLDGEASGSTISYFDHQHTIYAEQQLSQMEHLKNDILSNGLRWYLQPQVHAKNRNFKGFELMVHWYCGDKKPVELEQFSEIAGHSGEAYLLTKQMIEQAFLALVTLQQHEVYKPVAVNLISKDVLEADLVEFIEQQIDKHNIAGKYLMIEVAEPLLFSASAKAKNIIAQLKALEVKIAIDGFSGSYESLRYVRKMAIDQVKIDCQQLRNTEDRTDKAIINSLISLTRSMQLPLIGVGIDTGDVEQVFAAIGGEFVQGQAVNSGVVVDEFEIWLKRWLDQHSG